MEKRAVYSMLAELVVFTGTKDECFEYAKEHSTDDNQMYVVGDVTC
jgi:hypothetical protein